MPTLHLVPPSPEIMAILYTKYLDYLKLCQPQRLSFSQYLAIIGYSDPAHDRRGMDDALHLHAQHGGLELIDIPDQQIVGALNVKVLLIDFPDRPGTLPVQHYKDLLFSQGTHPTGGMYDYYQEVSLGKVTITGSVYGWLRLPQPYAFYTNYESGIFGLGSNASYPRNAQGMAEDAVAVALALGVPFEPELNLLNRGAVTALFLIHSGRGAEQLHPSIAKGHIWSHKWNLRQPVEVAPDLFAATYLTVPHDCQIGVCCHELGHLAMQWQDFYDSNGNADGTEWSGTGKWDLMAGGSWNGNGTTPAHPAALHKIQHDWIATETIVFTKGEAAEITIELNPYTSTSGCAIKIISPHYAKQQYLLLENRTCSGFDRHLPGEGLLVWRVDEREEMIAPGKPGLLLIQADGLHELENNLMERGDAGDPFPGTTRKTSLGATGSISTSFPDQHSSHLTLANITRNPTTDIITLLVRYDGD